jgi:hypothetical protein
MIVYPRNATFRPAREIVVVKDAMFVTADAGVYLGNRAGGLARGAVRAPRPQDVVVHRSFRRYGDQVENPRGR